MGIEDFDLDGRLGQGAYAGVFKVVRKRSGKTYALKKVEIKGLSPKDTANALNEIRVLASFNHPRIVAVHEIWIEDETDLCIVMEYCGHQDLEQKIKRYQQRREHMDERVIWVYLIQTLEGLRALHEKNVLHRDLKPANCFVAADGSVKIGDFNISKIVHDGANAMTVVGTPFYMAPEIWQSKPYSHAADIWSLGCTIYELAALRPPFHGTNVLELQAKIPQGVYDPLPTTYSKALCSVIDSMLRQDPAQRPTAAELLETPSVQACQVLVKNKLPHGEIPLRTRDQAVLTPLSPEEVMMSTLRSLASRFPPPNYPEDVDISISTSHSSSGSSSSSNSRTSMSSAPSPASSSGMAAGAKSDRRRGDEDKIGPGGVGRRESSLGRGRLGDGADGKGERDDIEFGDKGQHRSSLLQVREGGAQRGEGLDRSVGRRGMMPVPPREASPKSRSGPSSDLSKGEKTEGVIKRYDSKDDESGAKREGSPR